MKQKEAEKKIADLITQSRVLVNQATEIADAHGVDFYYSVSYGMGGRYYPDQSRKSEWEGDPDDYWAPSNYDNDSGGFWQSSSSNC